MFAKPIETKPASPPSTTIGSGFAGLKPTPAVGKLAGFNPTSNPAPRTTPPVGKGPMSAIAQAKAALFERAQQANSSPTTPVMAPNRASISSINSITSVGSARDPSSPTTPVSASPFRKSSVSSMGSNFRDNGNSQMSSPTTPVSASPFRKPSISTVHGLKEPTNAPQASSPTTSFVPTSLRKASISGMNATWDPTSVQATSTATPFTPKSLRKASISGMSHFKEPAVAPQTSLPTAPLVSATIRRLSMSSGSGDNVREIVSGFKTHSRTPSVDTSTIKTRSRAPSVSVDVSVSVSAFQARSRAPSISADVGEIKVRSRSTSIHLNHPPVPVQATLPAVDTTSETEPMVPATEIQDALVETLASVEVLTSLEEPTRVKLPNVTESSAPVEIPIHVASDPPSEVDPSVFSPETSSPIALASFDAKATDCESTLVSQLEEELEGAADPVAVLDVVLAPTAVETLMEEELVNLIILSKTKEEMLQSAPEEPVLSPVSSHASSHSRKSGIFPQKFHWKHGGEIVKVTGTFDDWKETVHLRKVPSTRDEFAAIVDLDRTKHIQFKFVVDGVWRCSTEFATEYDCNGNLNNVLTALPHL
ncbi:hypothetical protein EC968_003168 [Mortierella alpina]|nr:hypothetical protein EC968_003168 [Mortierella alpina]